MRQDTAPIDNQNPEILSEPSRAARRTFSGTGKVLDNDYQRFYVAATGGYVTGPRPATKPNPSVEIPRRRASNKAARTARRKARR